MWCEMQRWNDGTGEIAKMAQCPEAYALLIPFCARAGVEPIPVSA